MTKRSLVVLSALLLTLAACGGGGGTSGGSIVPASGGNPTPTPTPTPTATPSGGATPAVVPGPGFPLTGTPTYKGAWSPYGVANALDLPVQHGWDGTGQTVAIVIDSDVDRSVVQAYLSNFGITETGTITTVSVDGSSGIPSAGATSGDQVEAYLDVETVAGLAPGANIRIYQINDLSDASITKAYSRIDSDGIARVVNSSFGGCEYAGAPEDPYIAKGASAGIAYVASAGDSGNVCDGNKQVGASWPASNPNAIGVGGNETDYTAGYTLTNPTVWNDNSCAGSPSQCAGGGGVSSIYAIPSYQNGLAGVSSSTQRNVPDLSMPAEDTSIYDGTWGSVNGTSWSAPEYSALMAQVYQYCRATGGIANPSAIPYFVASSYAGAYIDVTAGNDQFAGTSPFYAAAAGYDDASGFGVPHGMAFANTVCPGGVKAPGVLSRTAQMTVARTAQPIGTNALGAAPPVSGLSPIGARSPQAPTRVQIVLSSDGFKAPVESALEAAGFTIDRRFDYEGLVNATAPSSAVERFFSTRMEDVGQSGHGVRYRPAGPVRIPSSIAPYVQTVSLNDLVARHVLIRR